MSEVRDFLGVEEESVDGAPGVWESVANLKEELRVERRIVKREG